MPEPGDRRSSASLRWLCWLPLVSLLAVEAYVGSFEGWGSWASAPILLVPAVISLAVVLPAVFDCLAAIRAGTLRPTTVLFTVIAGLPIIWLGMRRHVL